ncbi:BREX-1 system phosphatase PglZ type A [Methanosarcina sp. WWM596]|uniref:BREX-1 system phosphatase PglZ type A n=1 Tax=Methanosarcina sp. WWM596 TaxID=1434103 RepID=UPI000615784C|nr:BREX-1 system phosphatase PglZ type A [Methanosarcina sp. WWM596]AKB18577.1 putative cytoplasmic protein [Methanosarcina sp. WWM596]
MVNVEKTSLSILKKFSSSELKDYEKRKIVFWYDRDKIAWDQEKQAPGEELEEIIQVLEGQAIKFHILDNNYFETKKLLEIEDLESNYLIYCPEKERAHEDNWLFDIQLYSSRFENSRISDIKSEFEIDGHELDDFFIKHEKFFGNQKERVQPLKKLYQKDWREKEFILGMLAVFSKTQALDFKLIVRDTLLKSLDEAENPAWENISKFGLEEGFWELAEEDFGFSAKNPTLKKLFLSFLVTHIKRYSGISLSGYDQYVDRKENECQIFLKHWMDSSRDSKIFEKYTRDILEENGQDMEKSLQAELDKHDVQTYLEAEAVETFDKALIVHILKSLNSPVDSTEEDFRNYLAWIDTRRTKHWFSEYENIYNALEYAVKLFWFAREYYDNPKASDALENTRSLYELFKAYAETYYQIDYLYRKFYYYYDKEQEKDILKKSLRPQIEDLYTNKLLGKLLLKWSSLIDSELNEQWKIELADSQKDFYKRHVNKILQKDDRSKVAVIISDALRYEAAVELFETLNKDTWGLPKLSYMVGVLPSYTKLGMASLLPHQFLEYKEKEIFVDGINSNGLENRKKILQNNCLESLAIRYEDFMKYNRDEARELVKGKRVLYVYHDKIDSVGDKQSSENSVFDAVEETIFEIKKLVKHLSETLNTTNIIVTTDHGFLYRRDDMENADKVETSSFDKTRIIDTTKRFILSNQELATDNSPNNSLDNIHNFDMRHMLGKEHSPLFAYVPKTDLRFKLQGGGLNFVHGGASPQEIVIPVLTYTHRRNEKTLEKKGIKYGKVNVSVINDRKKITSSKFNVKIFQTEKVTDKMKPRTIKVSLWDIGGGQEKMVSDEKIIIANNESDEPEERQYNIMLTLGNNLENKTYYLRLVDEDPAEIKDIARIPFELDLLIGDFDDF